MQVRGVPTVLPYPYTLRSTLQVREVPGAPLERRLDFADVDGTMRVTLLRFDTDMTKKMHLIVVSDDFASFMHVHPVLGSDGHFRLALRFPRAAHYHLYADALPHAFGRTVFRYDVAVGGSARKARDEPAKRAVTVGPYSVAIDASTIYAGRLSMLNVAITKHGEAARDLHPYLGALAHAVLIGERDLSYVHGHAMSMETMMKLAAMDDCEQHTMLARMNLVTPPPRAHVPDAMMVHLTPPRRGRYKLWVQFRGGSQIYAAPFIINAI